MPEGEPLKVVDGQYFLIEMKDQERPPKPDTDILAVEDLEIANIFFLLELKNHEGYQVLFSFLEAGTTSYAFEMAIVKHDPLPWAPGEFMPLAKVVIPKNALKQRSIELSAMIPKEYTSASDEYPFHFRMSCKP